MSSNQLDNKKPVNTPSRRQYWLEPAIVALLILLFLFQVIGSVAFQNATCDERVYFGVGRDILRTGEWSAKGAILHPPLSYYVNSLPLLFLSDAEGSWAKVEGGYYFLAFSPFHLFSCRLTSLIVFGVPLLIVIYLWARELYDRRAAFVALVLAVFSPNLLAHSGLITPDLPLTCVGFTAMYLFWRYRRVRSWGRGVAWSVVLGLAMLTKVSAVLFLVSVIILGLLSCIRGERNARWIAGVMAGFVIAWLVISLGYGFAGVLDFSGKAAVVQKVPDQTLSRAVAWMSAPFLPLPYLRGAGMQWQIGQEGWPAFLMGELSKTGWWYYFVIAFLIKVPVAVQLILLASVVSLWWRRSPWLDEAWLIVPPIVFLGFFSFIGRVNIGLRYILPGFPFLWVFASKIASVRGRAGAIFRVATLALFVWLAISCVMIFPHYLAYFNEFVGGPANGYKYLVDSNLDWSQNRSMAEEYAKKHGAALEPRVLPRSGRVVVCANHLQGIFDPDGYRVLREYYKPIGHIGYNWLIFDLDREAKK